MLTRNQPLHRARNARRAARAALASRRLPKPGALVLKSAGAETLTSRAAEARGGRLSRGGGGEPGGVAPILFVLAAALLWSTGGLFIKATPALSAYELSFGRSLLAALTVG